MVPFASEVTKVLRCCEQRDGPSAGSLSTKAHRKHSSWLEGASGLRNHVKDDPMRIFRHYSCDYGHQWVVQRGDYDNEQPSDLICPEGHPAITGRVEFPVDDVQILISPAARVVDQPTQQRVLDGRYYLSL